MMERAHRDSGLRIRPGRLDEADRLDDIARSSKASWGYPSEWIDQWADELRASPDRLAAGDVLVAEVAGRAAGWAALGETDDGPEIAHFWVHPDAQGRGVGRALFEAVRAEAVRRAWPSLRVESDPHAVGFYEALGGRVVDRLPASMDGEERWLPVLEIETGRGAEPDPVARHAVELSEVDDALAAAERRSRKRLLVATGMTLVGPVNFLIQALVFWSDGWRPLGPAVFGITVIVSVGLWLQWRAARGDVRELKEDRLHLLEDAPPP